MYDPLPRKLVAVKQRAALALSPIKPADETTEAREDFLFRSTVLQSSNALPPYYLVYFLLVQLLQYRDLGQIEKIAWSVQIDFEGRAFLIEHAKFGLRLCGHSRKDEANGREIVRRIGVAVDFATPYFEWLAERAHQRSELNVKNTTSTLFSRYLFFREAHRTAVEKLEAKDIGRYRLPNGETVWMDRGEIASSGNLQQIKARNPGLQAEWLAIAAIDTFFSWTEQAFVHIAILRGKLTTGTDVTKAADQPWPAKFELAINLGTKRAQRHLDKLTLIRRQVRNYMAHGAFGKRRAAFSFHSATGAVPMLMPGQGASRAPCFASGLGFEEPKALKTIDRFLDAFLWTGERRPAEIYLMQTDLPLVLTYANDGTYAAAMKSVKRMTDLVDRMAYEFDRAANMDW